MVIGIFFAGGTSPASTIRPWISPAGTEYGCSRVHVAATRSATMEPRHLMVDTIPWRPRRGGPPPVEPLRPVVSCRRLSHGRPIMRVRVLRYLGLLTAVAVSAALMAGPGEAQNPRKGGVLRVGMIGEAPTLDVHTTTAVISREIAVNIFEGLYALDAKYQPVPLLAVSHEILDGGKRYAIRLRKDVKFHNGKPLTSADVVASLKRWGAIAGTGKATFKVVESVEAKGPDAIEIRLKEPSGSLLTVLASVDNAAFVYPKDVVDATGDGQLKEFVGTGPFKFVEHKPDRHIKLARFDGYAARSEAPSRLAGRRVAHLDELYFMPVPDYATRQAGITTGEYNYIQQVKPDQYERLKSMAGVETVVVKPYGWATLVLNHKQGLLTDKRLRQAIQAAL